MTETPHNSPQNEGIEKHMAVNTLQQQDAHDLDAHSIREDSLKKLGDLLSERLMAAQSGDKLPTPNLDELAAILPGLDRKDIANAFLATGILTVNAEADA